MKTTKEHHAVTSRKYVFSFHHDNALKVCLDYGHLISDEEKVSLNWMCMAHNNGEMLDRDIYNQALSIINRVVQTQKIKEPALNER